MIQSSFAKNKYKIFTTQRLFCYKKDSHNSKVLLNHILNKYSFLVTHIRKFFLHYVSMGSILMGTIRSPAAVPKDGPKPKASLELQQPCAIEGAPTLNLQPKTSFDIKETFK